MGVIYLLVSLQQQRRTISYDIYLLVKSIAAHARLKLAVLPRVQPCFLYTNNKLVCGSGTAPEWVRAFHNVSFVVQQLLSVNIVALCTVGVNTEKKVAAKANFLLLSFGPKTI